MILQIKIKDQTCAMTLIKGRVVLGQEVFPFDRSLAEQLIVKLDKLCARSKMKKSSLGMAKLMGEIDKNSTNFKLLQAFMKGLEVAS